MYTIEDEFFKRINLLRLKPIHFNDLTIKILNTATVYHKNFTVIPNDTHPWYEFNFVFDGCNYTTIEGVEFFVDTNQSFLIAPGQQHMHRAHQNTEYSDFCIQFIIEKNDTLCTPPLYNKFVDVLNGPHQYAFDSKIETLSCNNNLYLSQTIFLNWIFNLYHQWHTEVLSPKQSNGISIQINEFLNKNYKKSFKSNELAGYMHLSYRHISREYKKETGTTIVDMLNTIRCEKASELLLETDLPISNIALMTGFENTHYFSKVFRDYFHLSPTEYRQLKINI